MATTASPPTITQNLPLFGKVTYTQGDVAEPLTVVAEVADGGTLSYQWYRSGTDASPKIEGATENSYTPPTDEIGSRSYHCEIMNKNPAGLVAWAYSNSVTVTVVASDWSGDGDDTHTHSYSAVVTDPTCTESGYVTYECDCGDSYSGGAIPATGHQWSDNTCTVCGVTRTVKRSNVVDFFAGLMMGQRIKKIKNAVATATQYLYGTPSDTGNIGLRSGGAVTLYDGAVAQSIDEVWTDKETYPYVAIGYKYEKDAESDVYVRGNYHALIAKKTISVKNCDDGTEGWTPANYVLGSGAKIYEHVDGEWVRCAFYTMNMVVEWANYDVMKKDVYTDPDGDVYLSASDPIHVSGIVDYVGDIPIYEVIT